MLRLAIVTDRLLITILIAVLACLAVVLLAYLRQEKMIYFPNRYDRSALTARARRLGPALWPADSDEYHGLVGMDLPGRSKGIVLVFHGNAGSAIDRIYYVEEIQRLGYRVVLFEYPGYGARDGSPGEAVFVAAAVRAARAAVEEFGGPLIIWGESLGCGVASAVAGGKEIEVSGVVLLTPWDTLPDLAQDIYRIPGVKQLVRDRYDNIENLRDYDRPIAVIMAEEDEIIPNERTMNLYESLPDTKRLWTLRGAGHNDWLAVVDNDWWKEVMDFASEAAHDK
jgi:pimeloyl-ACP methyl ester carboxylesterase